MGKILLLFLVLAELFRDEIGGVHDQNKIDSLESAWRATNAATARVKDDSIPGNYITAHPDTAGVNTLLKVAYDLRNNDPEESIQYSRQALQYSNKLNFKKGVGEADVLIGIANCNLGSYDEALKYLLRGLDASRSINDKQTASRALNNIGIVYNNKGSYNDAFKNYREALELLESDNKKGIADCYSSMGMTYERQGNYEEAMKFQSAALKLRKEIGDQQGIAVSFNFSGMIYRRLGDYASAMQNYLAALKIQEDTGDKSGLAYSIQNIGIINILQSNYSEAMKNLSASLKIFETIKNKRGIGDSYGNIGWCYAEQRKYTESLMNTLAALEIFKGIGDRQNMGLYYNNAGFIYNKQGNSAEAMKNLLLAVQLFEEIEDKANTAEVYESIGEAYSSMGKYAVSITWLNKGLKAATEINEKRIVTESYASLAKVYEKLKDFKRAYKFHILYTDIKEQVEMESNSKVADMKTRYETDKKEKEIQLLNKDKEIQAGELKRQAIIKNVILGGVGFTGIFTFFLVLSFNRRKKTSFEKQVTEVEMKALRSQMNPHFIFNSLHSINEYIQRHKTTLASEYLVKFSKLMRAILENSRQKEIILSKEIEVLELYMELESQRMEHPFSYTIDIDPEIDPDNTLIPPMLLQPLVENSIRHGLAPKQEPGKIIIRIKKQNETIQCEVEDDGIGREVSRSVNKELKAESYGLKITAERLAIIEQIKKIKTNLTFRDLNEADNSTGLYVAFALPLEEAV